MVAQTYLATQKLASENDSGVTLTKWEIIDTMKSFDPAWKELTPAEQRRIVECLVEKVTVNVDGLDVRLRIDGIHSLISSLKDTLN